MMSFHCWSAMSDLSTRHLRHEVLRPSSRRCAPLCQHPRRAEMMTLCDRISGGGWAVQAGVRVPDATAPADLPSLVMIEVVGVSDRRHPGTLDESHQLGEPGDVRGVVSA